MIFAIPLVVALGVVGVHSPIGRRLETPLSPAETRQLGFDRWVGIISCVLCLSHQWRTCHRVCGLDNYQIMLLPMPGVGWRWGGQARAAVHLLWPPRGCWCAPACINPWPDSPATALQYSCACTSGPPSGRGPTFATARWSSQCCGSLLSPHLTSQSCGSSTPPCPCPAASHSSAGLWTHLSCWLVGGNPCMTVHRCCIDCKCPCMPLFAVAPIRMLSRAGPLA